MEFEVLDKTVVVFGAEAAKAPVVYLNTVRGEGREVWEACQNLGCPPFVLAAVSGLEWDRDMSPWAIPAIAPDDTPCTGGADDYLALLTEEIVPKVEASLPAAPAFRALAGYSLAGLFALYAAYRTALFTRIASISGSLWFPDFLDYVLSHELKVKPERLYLSLGDREAKTKNPYLKTVGENTGRIAAHYRQEGICDIFEWNPGNHFHRPQERTAKGIAWILKTEE